MSKFSLVYLEKYHPYHGFSDSSAKDIESHFFKIFSLKSPSKYISLINSIYPMDRNEFYEFLRETPETNEIAQYKDLCFHLKMTTKTIKQYPNANEHLNDFFYYSWVPQIA
jgi:hypothetical protein